MSNSVISHYTAPDIAARILAATRSSTPSIDSLGPYDEFHSGGRAATLDIMARMNLTPGIQVLDLGCGVGGASRVFASLARVKVTGVDISADYITAAQSLSILTGLAEETVYKHADVLSLPFANSTYDAAYTLHVGMNITDRIAFYQEAHRALKPDSVFAVYDVMLGPAQEKIPYPMPWANSPDISFLLSPAQTMQALKEAGFTISTAFSDMTVLAAAGLDRAIATGFSPPVMGSDAAEKMSNLAAAFANRSLVTGCILAHKMDA